MSHGLRYKKNMGILRIFNRAVEFSALEGLLSAGLVMLSIFPAIASFYEETLQLCVCVSFLLVFAVTQYLRWSASQKESLILWLVFSGVPNC